MCETWALQTNVVGLSLKMNSSHQHDRRVPAGDPTRYLVIIKRIH